MLRLRRLRCCVKLSPDELGIVAAVAVILAMAGTKGSHLFAVHHLAATLRAGRLCRAIRANPRRRCAVRGDLNEVWRRWTEPKKP